MMPSLAVVAIVLGLALSGGAFHRSGQEERDASLLFVRKGGGSLEFRVAQQRPGESCSVAVSVWSFRPCDIRFELQGGADNGKLFALLARTLRGEEVLEGILSSPVPTPGPGLTGIG